MIDVYEQIKPLLSFDSEDDFYYLQILQRRKDNPETVKKNSIIIKDYFIDSFKDFDKKYTEIKELCYYFNARAGLRLNKRSFKKIAYRTLNIITTQMIEGDYQCAKKAFTKACGKYHAESKNNNKWIVDIDEKDPVLVSAIKEHINNNCRPIGDKVIIELPTKNGIHLITKPFDKSQFLKVFKLDIQCDNPINLFIPGV